MEQSHCDNEERVKNVCWGREKLRESGYEEPESESQQE